MPRVQYGKAANLCGFLVIIATLGGVIFWTARNLPAALRAKAYLAGLFFPLVYGMSVRGLMRLGFRVTRHMPGSDCDAGLLCDRCGYNLRGQPDLDGDRNLVRCPECGELSLSARFIFGKGLRTEGPGLLLVRVLNRRLMLQRWGGVANERITQCGLYVLAFFVVVAFLADAPYLGLSRSMQILGFAALALAIPAGVATYLVELFRQRRGRTRERQFQQQLMSAYLSRSRGASLNDAA